MGRYLHINMVYGFKQNIIKIDDKLFFIFHTAYNNYNLDSRKYKIKRYFMQISKKKHKNLKNSTKNIKNTSNMQKIAI